MNEDLTRHLGNDLFACHVGISLVKVEPGYALASMKIQPFHMNGVNRVQGGAIFTLADYTFAAAANTQGNITLGISTNMSYFKSPCGKTITAEAREVSTQTKICGYIVDVFDEDGTIVAQLSGMGYIKKRDKSV